MKRVVLLSFLVGLGAAHSWRKDECQRAHKACKESAEHVGWWSDEKEDPNLVPICRPDPNPWYGRCRNIPGLASLYIHENNLIADYSLASQGAKPPSVLSCPRCPPGTEYAYPPINPLYDLPDVVVDGNDNLVVGRFSCSSNTQLCLSAADGSLFRGYGDDSRTIAVLPTPYCIGAQCQMVALLLTEEAQNATDWGVQDANGVKYPITRFLDINGVPLSYKEGGYIIIKGLACNSCAASFENCDKAPPGTPYVRPPNTARPERPSLKKRSRDQSSSLLGSLSSEETDTTVDVDDASQ